MQNKKKAPAKVKPVNKAVKKPKTGAPKKKVAPTPTSKKTLTRITVKTPKGTVSNVYWDEKSKSSKVLPKGQFMDKFGTIVKNPKGVRTTTKVEPPKRK
jgi:hypothetical protein